MGLSDVDEGDNDETELSVPESQVGGVCADSLPDNLPRPLGQDPAGSGKGSIYPKPYELGKLPFIEPERDILPIGGLIAFGAAEGSGWSGIWCEGGVGNCSGIPPETAGLLEGRCGPLMAPADKEWWWRVGSTGSDQDECIPGK